jgi:outer membrane protein assembly factor BamB
MPRLLFVAVFLFAPVSAWAGEKIDPLDNWPHWRGPRADGSAPRGNPPLKWDATTNIVWKTALPGRGASTPIVWGDQVFVLSAIDTGRKADPKDLPRPDPRFQKKTNAPTTYHQFVVLAIDRKTGKIRWQRTAAERVPHEGHHLTHSYAAGSPTTDGKRLYLSFGSQGVYCYDLDGKLLWSRNLGRLETRLGWGEASTPVIHDGKLFLTWDQEAPSFITALDAATGKTLWKTDRDEPSSWATPLVVTHKGKTQVIVPGTRKVRSYDGATGEVVWTSEGLTINCIPSPVQRGEVVYVMAGYGKAIGAAISLDATGDVSKSDKLLWKIEAGTPYVPSPVLAGDRLWFTLANVGFVTCIDAQSGKVLINSVRLGALKSLYASPVAAADRIYFTSREGKTIVLKQADKIEILSTNSLDEEIDASPAVVGRQLFLRGAKHLWCIEEKADGGRRKEE